METESSLQTEKHPKAWLGIIWVVLFFILDTIGQFFAIFPPVIEAIQSGRSVEATLDTIQISWYFNAAEAFAIAVVLFLAYLTGMKFFSLRPFTKKVWFQFIWISLATLILSSGVEVLINYLSPDFTTANQSGLEEMIIQAAPLTIFVSVVILAPIVEEVIFRGFVMKIIFWKYPKIGFVVSTLLFTFAHIPTNFSSFLIYFVMAFGLALMYYKTKRLEACILLHFANNLIAFFFLF
ncbi:caax amino protease family protein [Listeria floridensis FSL S10-1187]|uniref:Caax amino protease family protein n=1 Tax=Listeria floridensis FSL S10-1187 TaxID=1265817 RepID=A0ABN0RER5_9LIST|nr:CPBP family intramembrane glutamic endopeptidase [Listeria floridensis]EUJ31257.1 caax amino protease family protein [Listeria floridensis FSL S10-1187]